MALSDLHFGQHNKGFDIEVAKKRIAELPERLLDATCPTVVDEVVVLMMGDMVEGEDIYPSQAHHLVCSAMEQVEIAAASLWDMIKKMRELFKVPVRVVCCPGNHGRTGYGSHEKSNWDNMLYHALKIVAKEYGDKNIGIDCDYSDFKTFMVKDKKGMIYHHGVKHNGTPAMREKIAGWVYAKEFNFMCSGHWHEWKVGCWAEALWMANGSLCGPNDLSERIAQEGPARQGYFFVSTGRPLWGFSYIEWKNNTLNEISPHS
jgi:predicted phosphodiesterase